MAEYELFVDDNYHYMDENSRYRIGSFASYSDALAQAKAIVDEFLERTHSPGMTSEELFEGYVGFGEDPFIVPAGEPYFSAWDYARERCKELCRDEDAISSILRYPDWPPELIGFKAVLQACLERRNLGASERTDLCAFRRAVEGYPDSMPREKSRYWLRLERGSAAYTVYLYPDRFELRSDGVVPEKVEWSIRFRGSGLRDVRVGDASTALAEMRRAALSSDFILRTSG